MYTKEELESMKFKQLKSIARHSKISHRLTTKREIIDSLLNFEQGGENLDEITVTLVDNSDVEDNLPEMSEKEGNQESAGNKKPIAKTRLGRRRFPKPRMTIFQTQDSDDDPVGQSGRRIGKYFSALESKISKLDASLNSSSESLSTSDVRSAKKSKSAWGEHNKTSVSSKRQSRRPTRKNVDSNAAVMDSPTESYEISGRTRRGGIGKYSRALESKISKLDASLNSSSESLPTSDVRSAKKSKSVWDEHNKTSMSSKRQSRRPTRNFMPKQNDDSNPILMESPTENNGITGGICGTGFAAEQLDSVDNVMNFPRTESRITRRARRANVEDKKPQLDETFEVEELQSDDMRKHQSGHRNKTKLRKSMRKKRQDKITSPTVVLDNAASDFKMQPSVVLMPERDDAFSAHLKKVEKRRSRSCPRENTENDYVKIQLFSPSGTTAKRVDSHKKDVDIEPQLDETFEIEELQSDDMRKCLSGNRNKTKLRKSVRIKGQDKVPSPTDVEDIEPQLDETFEVEELQSDDMRKRQSGNRNKTKLRKSVRIKGQDKVPSPTDAHDGALQPNDTFEEEHIAPVVFKHEVKEEKSSSELRRSARRKVFASTTEDFNKISLREDNAASDFKMQPSVVLMSERDDTSSAPVEKVEKRRSRSCPRENTENDYVNIQFFSPSGTTAKRVDSHKKATPVKTTRIPTLVKKIPDFQNIHKKQFAKMESLVENQQRKQERARFLMSPMSTKGSVMVFTAKPSPLKKPATQNLPVEIAAKPSSRLNAQQYVLKDRNESRPYIYTKSNTYSKQNVKEIITNKLPIHDRRENVRQESRTQIRGVRLNRRFELQMAHRKIN